MRSNLAVCSAEMAMFLAISIPTFGHHGSRVSYDLHKELTMKGAVTAYVYQNPHIYVMYDVKGEDGNVVALGGGDILADRDDEIRLGPSHAQAGG